MGKKLSNDAAYSGFEAYCWKDASVFYQGDSMKVLIEDLRNGQVDGKIGKLFQESVRNLTFFNLELLPIGLYPFVQELFKEGPSVYDSMGWFKDLHKELTEKPFDLRIKVVNRNICSHLSIAETRPIGLQERLNQREVIRGLYNAGSSVEECKRVAEPILEQYSGVTVYGDWERWYADQLFDKMSSLPIVNGGCGNVAYEGYNYASGTVVFGIDSYDGAYVHLAEYGTRDVVVRLCQDIDRDDCLRFYTSHFKPGDLIHVSNRCFYDYFKLNEPSDDDPYPTYCDLDILTIMV